MDNPQYPWSQTGGNTPEEFVAGWRYVVNFFKNMGASNVIFVWIWQPSGVARFFPGALHLDRSGLTLLNYGKVGRDANWYGFDELYNPFERQFAKLGTDHPTMLTEFGSTSYGGDRGNVKAKRMTSIATRHPEIRCMVFFHSDRDRNWATSWRPPGNAPFIDWTLFPTICRRCPLRSPDSHSTSLGACRRKIISAVTSSRRRINRPLSPEAPVSLNCWLTASPFTFEALLTTWATIGATAIVR